MTYNQLTTEDFIRRAKEVHGDKYDYSKVEYVNSHTPVCIVCPEHGEFWQRPSSHLRGQGHPADRYKKIAKKRALTTEDFIAKAKAIHGDKYDYSKVEYVNQKTKVCIVCPEHGEFWQHPGNHINSSNPQGCPVCGGHGKVTLEDFIAKAKAIHGDRYDYSKVEYVNNTTKVCIVCPEHGEFWQRPHFHLKGHGCPKCNGGFKDTIDDFIKKAREIHGDKYDYSKVEYVNTKTKVCIICPEHGEFWQTPGSHLRESGCPKCAGKGLSTEEWIKKAREIHGDKYDYSKVKYTGSNTKVCIICPEHGEFWQRPVNHTNASNPQGCPVCAKEFQRRRQALPFEEFLRRAREKYGDKYDYSNAIFVNMTTPIKIVCPIHGSFMMTPNNHLKGWGCTKCYHDNKGKEQRLGTEEFIRRAKEIHGDKYDYSKVNYITQNDKVCIICHEKDKFGVEHGEFWQTPGSHLSGSGCPKCGGRLVTNQEDFIRVSREVHGDKYDYSKVEYVDSQTKVCIICPEHGEFWQAPNKHLMGRGCSCCNRGLTKQYKFNLLNEFSSEYAFKSFLENNDENILYVILRNIEPKYDPIKKDIEKALDRSFNENPIKALEEKYSSDSDDDEDDDESWAENEVSETPSEAEEEPEIDLDDDDAVSAMISSDGNTETVQAQPTIEDMIKNTQQEIKVINKIEHLLTPEDRKYIMDKFLADKRRVWMLERESK